MNNAAAALPGLDVLDKAILSVLSRHGGRTTRWIGFQIISLTGAEVESRGLRDRLRRLEADGRTVGMRLTLRGPLRWFLLSEPGHAG